MAMFFSPNDPALMGVLNVTPDSFSDGGAFLEAGKAIAHGLRLEREGARILDVGGESTRPGAEPVTPAEELERILPVIAGLRAKTDAVISVDTRNPKTAEAAINEGATIWNDVSALSHTPESLTVAARLNCIVVLMHAQGGPKTMQDRPYYDDVVEEVYAYLSARIEAAVAAGVLKENIIVDPGIGFGKTLDHNLTLLSALERFQALEAPVLLGASRKRFIEAIESRAGLPGSSGDERLAGSIAAVLAGMRRGVSIFRVHDVKETRQAILTARAIDSA